MELTPFTKKIDISDGGLRLRIEAAKARCMKDALKTSRKMFTPSLLDVDEAQGLLVFEPVKDIQPLHPGLPPSRFAEIGCLLALVHDELWLPEELTFVRHVDEGHIPLVYVHGDFQPGNLGLVGDRLIVFDWGVRPWGDELYTRATPAVDVTSFLAPWFVPKWWDLRFPVTSLSAFLQSYIADSRKRGMGDLTHTAIYEAMQEHFQYNSRGLAARPQPARTVHYIKNVVNTWRFNRNLITET